MKKFPQAWDKKLSRNTLSTELPNVLSSFIRLTLQRSVDVTQNSLAYILKIIGAETEAALEMLRCAVQGFNQFKNIILLQNTKTMAVI